MFYSFEDLKSKLTTLFTRGHFIFFDYDNELKYCCFDNVYVFYQFLIDNFNVGMWVFSIFVNSSTGNFYIKGYLK